LIVRLGRNVPWAATLAALGGAGLLAGPSAVSGITVATLAWVEAGVERESADAQGWRKLKAGDRVRTGDRLRTPQDGLARLEFPWMSITIGPATVLHIPAEVVLSTVLGQGRAEFEARGREIVKVRTAEAEIRGAGRLVVRRERGRTLVTAMAMDGTFRVEAFGETVVLQGGEGTTVRDGEVPTPAQRLPEAPERIRPGSDPLYVSNGQPVTLDWSPAAPTSHVQVMPLDSDEVLMERDVGSPPYALVIPWEGTYRWRISSRDAQGLEGRPSEAGVICVVEK